MTAPREDWPFLPDLLFRVAEKCGLGAALRLGELYGGRPLGIPRKARPNDRVAQALGFEVLAALVEIAGGTRVDVPFGPAGRQAEMARRLRELDDQGLTAPQIALMLRITDRTVRKHRARRRDAEAGHGRRGGDERQLRLF